MVIICNFENYPVHFGLHDMDEGTITDTFVGVEYIVKWTTRDITNIPYLPIRLSP